eukprot:364091-Chlamydomonas_euryale.AAC.5
MGVELEAHRTRSIETKVTDAVSRLLLSYYNDNGVSDGIQQHSGVMYASRAAPVSLYAPYRRAYCTVLSQT